MDDINLQVQEADRLQRSPAEEDISLAVVFVVLTLMAIELRAIEVVVLLDKEDRHVGAGQRPAKQAAADDFVADWDVKLDSQRLQRQATRLHLAISRHDDRDVVPGLAKVDRQGAADIGQPPRFGKRGDFARSEDDVQVAALLRSGFCRKVWRPERL